MGAQNSSRSKVFGIAKETVFGTGVAPSAYPKFTSFSGGVKPNYVKSKSRLGNRASPVPVLDSLAGRAKVDFEVDPDNIGWFLKGLCGSEVSAVDGGGPLTYKHTFTPQNSAALPSFSLGLGNVVETFQALGAVLDTLNLDMSPKAIVTGGAEFVFREEGVLGGMTPSYTTLNPWVFSQMGITVDGVTSADVRKVSLSAKNGVKDDDFRANGAGKLSSITASAFELTGTIDGIWTTETKALRDKMKTGVSVPVVITLTGAIIEAAKAYRLIITIPYAMFDSAEIGDEEDGMSIPLPFTAGVGASAIVTFDLYNTRTTAY
jgi:hypothetical protein